MDWKFYRNVVLKVFLLFLIFNLILVLIPPSYGQEQFSLYNGLVPGRERFPFGETPREAYNFSLYDVDAMLASHTASAETSDEVIDVFVMGDSSVWGTLLKPEETLAGQLNAMDLAFEGKPVRFFNLGYPTISLTKDLMLMDALNPYDPDMVIWLTTLEAMPMEKQLASPLAQNNPQRITALNEEFVLGLSPETNDSWWSRTIFGRRRAAADWIRLQVYGIMWGATGVDQIYPEYTPAAWNLKADESYYDLTEISDETLLLSAFSSARSIWADTPLLVVNEPMMISTGENSDLRYNFFYPRWAYDDYRVLMQSEMDILAQPYVDAWDWVPANEYTNSAIHLTPEGEALFAAKLAPIILDQLREK